MRQVVLDTVSQPLLERLAVTLRRPAGSTAGMRFLPEGWHLAYCLAAPSRDSLSIDGLPAQDPFLPVLEGFPTRVMGATSMRFLGKVPVGAQLECESALSPVQEKQGRSGPLRVLRIARNYSVQGLPVIQEEQEVVFLPAPPVSKAVTMAPRAVAREAGDLMMHLDEVDLFRFSAVTFNSHRIHYDGGYATAAEGWPGRLAQAKLLALLLLEAFACKVQATPHAFTFRSVAPLVCPADVLLRIQEEPMARRADVAAIGPGGTCLQGQVEY